MKTKKRKLNVRLLRRIQKHILEEPRRFFMSWFVSKSHGNKTFIGDGQTMKYAPCGTAACIAGWVNILTRGKNAGDILRATKKLGLVKEAGNDQPMRLFGHGFWPEPFRSDYRYAKTRKQKAKIACARIDHLIKTGE